MYTTDTDSVECVELIGVHLWIHAQSREQYLRIVCAATYLSCDEEQVLDNGIIARRWATYEELESRRHLLRSPAVLRYAKDYAEGIKQSDALLTDMLPLQQNIHRVLASADLV